MAVRPIQFMPDGSIEIWHDERSHGGIVTAGGVQFARKPDGSEDRRSILLYCPVPGCDSMSCHPAGGGCSPEQVQRMFAKKLQREPKLGGPALPPQTKRPWHEAKDELKVMVEAMDGPGRWRLERVTEYN